MPTIQKNPLGAWQSLGIGAAAAVVGLLPWLVHGMQLPLQNLGTRMTGPGDLVLLPFSQYSIALIAALLIVGAAIAGIAARAMRVRFGFVLLGMLVIQAIAIVQTAVAVRGILRSGAEAAVYLTLLIGVAGLAVAIGIAVAALIARAARAGALIGLAVAAVLAGPWIDGLILPWIPNVGVMRGEVAVWLQWIPPVLVGVAIAWCGLASLWRVIAAIGALVILWIGGALLIAASAAAGMRVYAGSLPDLVDYGMAVFRSAATEPTIVVRSLGTAVVVALLGLAIGALARRRTAQAVHVGGAS